MTKIIAISGSLRKDSFNTALLREMSVMAPDGVEVEVVSIKDIPLYDGDVEAAEGVPAVVESLKEKIAAADGLLLSTPEYNNGMTGVLKNTIDWLSRPGSDIPRIFGNKKLGLVGVSAGRLGTAFSQTTWLPVLRFLNADLYNEKNLYLGGAFSVFEDGKIRDEATRGFVQEYLDGFVRFAS